MAFLNLFSIFQLIKDNIKFELKQMDCFDDWIRDDTIKLVDNQIIPEERETSKAYQEQNGSANDIQKFLSLESYQTPKSLPEQEQIQSSNNRQIIDNTFNNQDNDDTDTFKPILLTIPDQISEQTNLLEKKEKPNQWSYEADGQKQIETDKSKTKSKSSAQHNFPKFLCSDFKLIQRKIHRNQQQNSSKIPEIHYYYSQFFREGMIKSAGLRNIKQYLLKQQNSNLQEQFSAFLSFKNIYHLEYNFIELQNWARFQIIDNENDLISAASNRKMKQRLKYAQFVKVVLSDLKKGVMKQNHK